MYNFLLFLISVSQSFIHSLVMVAFTGLYYCAEQKLFLFTVLAEN